ncbi:MAG: hypothetical protein WBA46_01380 [Thermomicrobiales bacterium]
MRKKVKPVQALTQAALDFGGSNTHSGVSTSRTLMLHELDALLPTLPIDASIAGYREAIVTGNVLLKPSADARIRTYGYLRDRFALDPNIGIFAVLRVLWDRDVAGRPLMALLVAAFRDPLLRSTVPFVIEAEPGRPIASSDFASVISRAFPDRLGVKTLKATSERMTATFRQSGHLLGRTHTVRQRVTPTPGSVALALLLASLDGASGYALFDTPWVSILDGTPQQLLSEARIASARGWLEIRQAGDVLDISFHTLLSSIGRSS